MSEEAKKLIAKARSAAIKSVYVNHPDAAFRLMRELAEHVLDLNTHLGANLQREIELETENETLRVYLDQALRQWRMHADTERQFDENWIEGGDDPEAQLYADALKALNDHSKPFTEEDA